MNKLLAKPGNYSKRLLSTIAMAALGSTLGLSIFSVAGGRAALAGSVSCDYEWAENAFSYLKNRTGYTPPFYYCYTIDAGETETVYITFDEVDLSMSDNHIFMAECDEDCGDLDLKVFDRRGVLVGEDLSSDSYAEVYLPNVSVNDTYRVEISMYDCDTRYCGAVLGSAPRR